MTNRVFETVNDKGEPIKLKIKEPTYYINRMCEIEYKKAWGFCISQGVKMQSQLEESLKEAGIWGPDQDKKLREVEVETAIFLKLMDEAIKNNKASEAKDAALSAALARNKVHDLLLLKQSAFTHSTEGVAIEVKMEAYVAYGTVYENDDTKTYWKNYDHFIQNNETPAAIAAKDTYTRLLLNEHIAALKTLPENKYLIDTKIMSDDLRVLVPEKVPPVTVEKTKRGRKKTSK